MSTRVHKLAKEIGLSSKELIAKLNKMGILVKNHLSSIEDPVATKIRGEFESKPTEGKPPESKLKRQKPKGKPRKREERKLRTFDVPEGATVKEFAEITGKDATDIIKLLLKIGETVTINQTLSSEEITVLGSELDYKIKIVSPEFTAEGEPIAPTDLEPRPPVVTIMGHVDHGKTRLLDAIRKTNVLAEEAGGITQHIGAYQIEHNGKKITFIDTPGHEAFTTMRARGAKVTDIAILVVAADDGVMPQTEEAIDHARAAGVPILVAINKVDKPEANPDKVRQQLSERGLVPEEWGGDTVFVDVSAKTALNLEELLEMIQLVAEMQELKASSRAKAKGVAVEAKIDKGRGPVATVLVQQGTLKIGDVIVAGTTYGRIRAMFNDQGISIKKVTPSQPVEILGFSSVPQAGDEVELLEDEKVARNLVEKRALRKRLIERKEFRHITLEDIHERIEEGALKELNLVIKGDVQGSLEALRESIEKIDQKQVKINIIHKGVGAISETDVMLASASDAIIIGFNVRPNAKAKEMADKEKVDVRTYRVIYQIVEDINAAQKGMLVPEVEETVLGEVEVRRTFKIPKVGTIAGCYVTQGIVSRNSQVRLIREGVVIQETTIASLKRFKDDVTEVKEGFECGIGLENFQDIKVGDFLEFYTTQKK